MAANTVDYLAIKNITAQYCLALDNKDFAALRSVFTADVDTIYPFRGSIKGVDAVAEAIQKRLTPVTTQHALTTQHIVIASSGQSADVTTYFTGIHFGQGRWKGQQVTAWGKYVDHLTCAQDGAPTLPGASGQWLIDRREVIFMSRLGEEGVMEGE